MLLQLFVLLPWSSRRGLALGLPAILGAFDISDYKHSFDHDKSSSISQLINSKSRNHQKLLKYFNGTTTSASDILLLFGDLPIYFFLYSKEFICYCFVVICLDTSSIIFNRIIIYFISIIIPQTS